MEYLEAKKIQNEKNAHVLTDSIEKLNNGIVIVSLFRIHYLIISPAASATNYWVIQSLWLRVATIIAQNVSKPTLNIAMNVILVKTLIKFTQVNF